MPNPWTSGERAEKLAQAYKDRQLTTQQTLFEFERLAQEYVSAQSQRQQMGTAENTFAIFKALQAVVPDFQAAQATAINALFARFPVSQWDDQQKSRLRAELYKALRPMVGAAKLIEITNTLLRLQGV